MKPGLVEFLARYPKAYHYKSYVYFWVKIRDKHSPAWKDLLVVRHEDSEIFDGALEKDSDYSTFAESCIDSAKFLGIIANDRGPVEIIAKQSAGLEDYYFCVHYSEAEDVRGPWNGENKYLVLMNVG